MPDRAPDPLVPSGAVHALAANTPRAMQCVLCRCPPQFDYAESSTRIFCPRGWTDGPHARHGKWAVTMSGKDSHEKALIRWNEKNLRVVLDRREHDDDCPVYWDGALVACTCAYPFDALARKLADQEAPADAAE